MQPASKLDVDDDVVRILIEADRLQRCSLAHEAPQLCESTAAWAAIVYCRSCEFLVHRDANPELVRSTLSQPAPRPRSSSIDYSADLVFQFLPDLLNLARRISVDDPLVQALSALARAWPLSSPGSNVPDWDTLDPFWCAPALRLLYVDRIMKRNEWHRAKDPIVRAEIEAVLGAHSEIAPRWAELKIT